MADVNVLIQEAQAAIEFIEDADAKKILKQLRQVVAVQKIKETDPVLFSRLEKLMIYLSVVAFPNLPDTEAAEVLRNHYLESYDIGVPMESRITAKLFVVPYLVRDEPRELLKKALLANNQKLGDLTLSQWIQEFEKQFNVNTRAESAPIRFMTDNQKVYSLSPADKEKLKRMLHTYDYLLVSTLPAIGEDLKNLMSVASQQKGEMAYAPPARYSEPHSALPQGESSTSVVTVNLPLLQALPKYENLGNQLITEGRIRVKSQAEPVRPSLLYWLKYYRDELGIGQHNSVERGNFLFRSENGKKLSGEERERISLILKSVEENLPLSIDPKSQEIVFPTNNAFSVTMAGNPAERDNQAGKPAFQAVVMPASTRLQEGSPRLGEAGQAKAPSPSEGGGLHISRGTSFIAAKGAASSPAQAKGVSFSTGHVLPVEKEAVESRDTVSTRLERGEPGFLSFQSPSDAKATGTPAFIVPKIEGSEAGPPRFGEAGERVFAVPITGQGNPVSAPVSALQPASATPQRGEPNPALSRSRILLQKLNSFRIRPVSLGRKEWERGEKDE
ncbi:MAG: hypothetical protein Q8Q10_03080 [bacterium]|nr:hypothetical protein [bacterium]